MIGTCRLCHEIVRTQTVCADTERGGAAVAVGLEFLQVVREHWTSCHPRHTWQEADVSGALAMLFPFLAGADVEAKQEAVLLLACAAMNDRMNSISFNALGGVLGPRPAGVALPKVDPLVQRGRVDVLLELVGYTRDVGPVLPAEWLRLEQAKLRAVLQSLEVEETAAADT